MLAALNRLLGRLLALAIVAGLAAGIWIGYQTFYAKEIALQKKDAQLVAQRAEIDQLSTEVKAKQRQIERLETAVRLLKVDHRVAQLLVLDQEKPEGGDQVVTKFRFVELNDEGNAIDEPRTMTIAGDQVYIDYWVVQFEDRFVERGDPLRSTSICLFRRVFGEFQQPNDGTVLDRVGSRPAAYGRGSEMNEFEREIWTNFWDYATDAKKAQAAGVRTAHGEAVSTKLIIGKSYKVLLRASGGLSITPDEKPTTGDGL